MTQDAIHAACYRWMRKAWLEGADTGEDPEILQAIEAVYSEEEMDAAVIAELQKPENEDLLSAALSEPQPKGTRWESNAPNLWRLGATQTPAPAPVALSPTASLKWDHDGQGGYFVEMRVNSLRSEDHAHAAMAYMERLFCAGEINVN